MSCKYFLCYTTLLIAIFNNCAAQNDIPLPGVVVIQNSKFATGKMEYIAGASIRSLAKSTPTSSDSKGEFTLIFSDKPAGDVARIMVAKQGYELVNTKELEAAAIIGRSSRLQVVMCRQGLLDENRMKYYQVSDRFIKEKYDNRLKVLLQQKGEKYNKVIDSLQVEMNQQIKSKENALALLDEQRRAFEKQSLELSEKFAIINLDDQSPTYQRAFKAFDRGNIDEAIAILDSVDLEKRLSENTSKKQKTESAISELQVQQDLASMQIKQDVNQCIFKAGMYKIRFQFPEAIKNYELAIKYDSTNYANINEFADLLLDLKQFDKAIILYNKLLKELQKLSEVEPDKYQLAIANYLDKCSAIYSEKNDFKKADTLNQQSLNIRERYINDTSSKSDLALTLNNRGMLYWSIKDFAQAKIFFLKSLEIRRQLAQNNLNSAEADLAISLNNSGVLYQDENDYQTAEGFLLESLEIRRRLSKDNPQAYEADLAQSLNNTGLLYSEKNDFKKAEDLDLEALEIYNRLAKNNAYSYEEDQAQILNNLGHLYEKRNDFVKADSYYLQSLLIYRRLATNLPQAYEPELSKILNNLGDVHNEKNDSAKAATFYMESLEIAIRLAQNNSQAFEPQLAQILKNLGLFYHDKNDSAKAATFYLQSLEIYKRLAEKNASIFEPQLAKVLDDLGTLYANKQDLKKAEDFYRDCAKIRLRLYSKFPEAYKNILVRTLDAYSTELCLQGKFSELEKVADSGIQIDDTYPFFKEYYATALLFQGKFDEAKKQFLLIKDIQDKNGHFFKKGILIDLDDLEKMGFTHPDVVKIRQLLME